ncbi:MAG: radical SAM protein [Planctomycetota bacterium]|jgi:MoaA/NifB/PqqE/SkfB family radical SAM enzyme
MSWKQHRLDGAIQRFQRSTGLNVRYSGPETAGVTRVAPRVLQVGLLTPCNLSCSFCYRDTSAPSRLDAPFLLHLLRQADEWGVCEVAFGGGEPLLFPGFTDLVRDLHGTTGLGVGFTTNGTLLTDDIAAELSGLVGEIRLSAYETNDYRTTLKRFAGVLPIGLNWMVTPATIGLVEATVRDALALGATNVLLLGYKGPDPALHLSDADLARLADAVRRCAGMPVKLDVCWYPKLKGVESLFERHDCEAGDDFLVITPDRAVQSCSFHESRFPFETFDELVEIYGQLRGLRRFPRS